MEYSETVPVQYQDGKAHFMGMDLLVDPRVLIPRPETELLVGVAAELCSRIPSSRHFILDLGVGSGAVSVGLKKALGDCRVIGADVSVDALAVARENIRRFDCEDDVELVVSDMFSAFRDGYEEAFDCVVSNPPYVSDMDFEKLDAWVRAEPELALRGGEEGMDCLNILAEESGRYLRPGGFLAVEVGYDQAEKTMNKFSLCGFEGVRSHKDMNGYKRVITGWKHG